MVRSSVTELPRDQWEVLIPGHHPGYITWEDYLANEAKLAANRTNAGARPPREGSALCQGIVFCGACGRSMQVRYQDRYPRYECSHSRAAPVATPLRGPLPPAPTNEPTAPPPPPPANPPQPPTAARPPAVLVGSAWKPRASPHARAAPRKSAVQLHPTDLAAVELACRIAPGLDNNALARALNDAGHRPGTGQPFDGVAAGNLRSYHPIPYPGLLEPGELSPRQVAERLGVSPGPLPFLVY